MNTKKKGRRLCFCLASIKFIRLHTHAMYPMMFKKFKWKLETSLRQQKNINSIMWESVSGLFSNNFMIFDTFIHHFQLLFWQKSNTSWNHLDVMHCGFLSKFLGFPAVNIITCTIAVFRIILSHAGNWLRKVNIDVKVRKIRKLMFLRIFP